MIRATWARWKHRATSFPFTCDVYDPDPKRRYSEAPEPGQLTFHLVSGEYDFIKRTACVVVCNGVYVEGSAVTNDLFGGFA